MHQVISCYILLTVFPDADESLPEADRNKCEEKIVSWRKCMYEAREREARRANGKYEI
jgi:hypothetical protein